jgi:hypothetical protein
MPRSLFKIAKFASTRESRKGKEQEKQLFPLLKLLRLPFPLLKLLRLPERTRRASNLSNRRKRFAVIRESRGDLGGNPGPYNLLNSRLLTDQIDLRRTLSTARCPTNAGLTELSRI